jgi:3-oxoacyl-[acyl-carrier protein] reductase
MELISGKVAIVTGAAAGIGLGIARLFAEQGAHVFLSDINGEQVERVASDLKSRGGSAYASEADARDQAAMEAIFEQAISRFGRIDALINNAGVYPRQAFLEMTEEQWDTMQDINLKSVYRCTKLAVPHMIRQASGTIVNISSVAFFLGMKNLTHYVASKGGVIGFTRSLAREVGEHNIRVNCITPGAVETEGEAAVATKEQVATLVELQSLKRRVVPLDIARACLFLSSELSGGVTGQTLNVDGGWVMY